MKRNIKIVIVTFAAVLFLLAWAPWLNDKEIHDKILKEMALKDGSAVPVEHYKKYANVTDDLLQKMIEESRKKGIENGILICDYKVMWFPFGRWVASCEGGYYVTFWGEPLYPPSGRGGIILP